jgi:hypothetical protein
LVERLSFDSMSVALEKDGCQLVLSNLTSIEASLLGVNRARAVVNAGFRASDEQWRVAPLPCRHDRSDESGHVNP